MDTNITAGLDLQEQVVEAISARLHVTTDRIPGAHLQSGLSADTLAVVQAAEAVMPLLAAERQAGRDEVISHIQPLKTRHRSREQTLFSLVELLTVRIGDVWSKIQDDSAAGAELRKAVLSALHAAGEGAARLAFMQRHRPAPSDDDWDPPVDSV